MSLTGTCETGCSEHRLELVRAAAYDALLAEAAETRARATAFGEVIQAVAVAEPQKPEPDALECAYRAAQRAARRALHDHPTPMPAIDAEEHAEHATTWWCAECGGLDAPQSCLGICVWRKVEWVERSLYEQLWRRATLEREQEQRLRHFLGRLAWVTPRPGHWEHGWRLLQSEARAIRPRRYRFTT